MGDAPRRLLLADTTPATRAMLEPLVRDEGWEMLSVDSSIQVLRTVRDANVDLVLIDPDLPGMGVSGMDVVKTLKGSSHFRHLPVLLLLHGERQAPAGIPADGAVALDRWSPARVVMALRQALGAEERGKVEEWPERPGSPGPDGPPVAAGESFLRALTELIDRVTARLDAPLPQGNAGAQESPPGSEARRQEIRGEVREVAERVVREVAREVVPEVAARLIAEEIERLRRDYGLD